MVVVPELLIVPEDTVPVLLMVVEVNVPIVIALTELLLIRLLLLSVCTIKLGERFSVILLLSILSNGTFMNYICKVAFYGKFARRDDCLRWV